MQPLHVPRTLFEYYAVKMHWLLVCASCLAIFSSCNSALIAVVVNYNDL